jgi:hypothetical protein
MRIPFYVAIPVSLLAILIVWWLGTRDIDFLRPPTEARLTQIRDQALASLPVSNVNKDAISIVVPSLDTDPLTADPIEFTEPVEIGDLNTPPTLDTYSDRAPEGADKLLRLAAALENRGAFQRALLAYERVLDLAQGNPEQNQNALLSIRRLRPTLTLWNNEPGLAQNAIIHIGTGEKFAEILPEVMETITKDLRLASSGLIKFSSKLNIGRSIQTTDAPTPVALWITGAGQDSPSTDVLSFTTADPQTLRNDILKTIFNLIRSHLSKTTSYNPAPEAVDEPMVALQSNITRLLWNECGTSLNPKPVAE